MTLVKVDGITLMQNQWKPNQQYQW
jgi:hypothetical protein